ncbi:Hin recombinase [Escherichia coli]|nr:Hin recombinase [Escherichia coli]
MASERIAELRQRVEAGEQKTKLAREFGISRETLYQYLRTDQYICHVVPSCPPPSGKACWRCRPPRTP